MMNLVWNFVKRIIEGINKNATIKFEFEKGIFSYFIASHDRIDMKKEEEIKKLKEEIKKLKEENKLLQESLNKKMDLNNEDNNNDEDDWESDDWD